ncbi:MAG TPA: methionyl-tRNA formyltransferase [Vicinamibacteria bacterium]|nr:methionyl-tRNA formyltransferase [Vicinamibacteria bacterium]
MRIVFLGSGSFAIPALEALITAGHEVATLVTQPDREKGRGRALAPPPLKPVALARGIPVLQPPRVRDPQALEALRALSPELQVVVAYGQILPRSVIEIPPRGTVNVHGSLLPRYRGAAPIAWAIASGETETGVTTMLIDEGLDTGPILLARSTPIGPEETAAELEPRLARLGAELLLETVRGLGDGRLQPQPQDQALAGYAPLLKKEDGRIDWTAPSDVVARRVRGFNPWPGTYTLWQGRVLKVLRARPAPGGPGEPGTVVRVDREGLVVACGHGTRLDLLEVQLEGRRPVVASAFSSGARLHPGARFG